MPAESKIKAGTSVVWTGSGSPAITAGGLVNNGLRGGAKGDFGDPRGSQWAVWLQIPSGSSAPTSTPPVVELYMSWSASATAGTGNDGGHTGTDAAYAGYSSNGEASLKHLDYIGAIELTALTSTVQRDRIATISIPKRYGSPVLANRCGQTLGSTSTDFRIEFEEIIDEAQDPT